jgi:hypothetical protein
MAQMRAGARVESCGKHQDRELGGRLANQGQTPLLTATGVAVGPTRRSCCWPCCSTYSCCRCTCFGTGWLASELAIRP